MNSFTITHILKQVMTMNNENIKETITGQLNSYENDQLNTNTPSDKESSATLITMEENAPLIRYFDLIEDSSNSYVLGYN